MPIRVRVLASVAGLNPQWGKHARKPIEDEIRNAIKAWVNYLATRLPTYTDTIRGTLRPAARVARGVVSSRGNKAPWKKEFIWQGTHYPLGFMKGQNYANAKLTSQSLGSTFQFTFEYNNWLPYFIWNNLQDPPAWLHLPSNPPWHALEAAAIVFKLHVETEVPRRLLATLGNLHVTVQTLKAY